MARIRTIKPEFFTSEDVVALAPLARILFVGLWCEADREGRLVWRPGTFKLRYLPGDDCDIDALAQQLVDRRLVVLYGDGLAYIPTWHKHQHINPREADSQLPAPPEDDASPRVRDASSRVSDASPRVQPRDSDGDSTRREEGKGKEGKGREGITADADHPTRPIRASVVRLPRDASLGLIEAWNVEARRVASWVEVDPMRLDPPAISRAVRALQALPDLDAWEARFARAARSSHLTGRNGKGFVADFWWLLDHVAELDAGRYDDRRRPGEHDGESRRPELVDISAQIAAEAEERRLAAEERAARKARGERLA